MLGWYPGATAEELERIGALVEAYCGSTLAARLAALGDVSSERPFAFEHDGVLFHGVLDVLPPGDGRALVADFKSNLLGDHSPAEVVDAEYRLQRLVYAIACFRAGVEEVEVVYQFLERPNELVAATFRRDQLAGLEAELSAAIARIQAGQFPPRPSEFACAGCPALDVVCAGPALNSQWHRAMHARRATEAGCRRHLPHRRRWLGGARLSSTRRQTRPRRGRVIARELLLERSLD